MSNDFFQWAVKNWLEIFGAVTGLLYIYLEIRQKQIMWVIGFISSFVYVFVYFQSKVYGYASLYIYYVVVSVYGWYCWRNARQPDGEITALKISRITIPLLLILTAVSAVLYVGIGYVLEQFTDSPVPFYEALGASLSIVATWMLARKILEHWMLWFFINFFSAALFFSLGLYPTVALFVVYGVMSVVGWFRWKQSIENEE